MRYPVAEKFKSLQGEGVYAGTPMAFIRLVGCSVGQKICTACDTDFDRTYPELGGGLFSPEDLRDWVGNYSHVCLTGGEPLNRDLLPLMSAFSRTMFHIETSGTVPFPGWEYSQAPADGKPRFNRIWLCVSPKPGYSLSLLQSADEIKVIYPGLGEGPGWMTIPEALAVQKVIRDGVPIYIQPRNFKNSVDEAMLQKVVEIVEENPSLRLSVQMHKVLRKR